MIARAVTIGLIAVAAVPPAAGAAPARRGAPAEISFTHLVSAGTPRDDTSRYEIDSVRFGSRRVRRLRTCLYARSCETRAPAWAPGGLRLAFELDGGTLAFSGRSRDPYDIVTGLAILRQPAWSPSGRRLAVAADRVCEEPPGARCDAGVGVIGSDGRGVRLLTRGSYDSSPSWSRRGMIAFERSPDLSAEPEIWTVPATGGTPRRLVLGADPAFSPSGRRIAFERGNDGVQDLYVMRADGTGVRRITRSGDNGQPAWSPGGTRIAYVRRDSIYVIKADGTGRRLVARPRGEDSLLEPAWRPPRR